MEFQLELNLSRINTNRFPIIYPQDNSFKTQVKVENGFWYSNLPEEDFRQLFQLYQKIPHETRKFSPINFVFKIDSRIFEEWCMSSEEGLRKWQKHSNYQGEGFTKFMDEEVHYELERPRSEQDRGSHEGYLGARQRVLAGLTLRAIELFTDWSGNSSPPGCFDRDAQGNRIPCKDRRNLRADLSDYLARLYPQLTPLEGAA